MRTPAWLLIKMSGVSATIAIWRGIKRPQGGWLLFGFKDGTEIEV
ncbi:MAG TPA: hypothetical protein VIO64_05595 [Pseudobacteroides sp.]